VRVRKGKSSGKRRIPEFRHRRFPIPELPCLELTLLDLLRQFDSANDDCRAVESFESQHRPGQLFDSAVALPRDCSNIGSIALLLGAEVCRSSLSPALRDAITHGRPSVILVGVRRLFIALRREVLANEILPGESVSGSYVLRHQGPRAPA